MIRSHESLLAPAPSERAQLLVSAGETVSIHIFDGCEEISSTSRPVQLENLDVKVASASRCTVDARRPDNNAGEHGLEPSMR